MDSDCEYIFQNSVFLFLLYSMLFDALETGQDINWTGRRPITNSFLENAVRSP